MSSRRLRRGTTLIEAILAMTVLSMLLVPMVALLKTSHLLWRKYESGHGAVSARQELAFEVSRILSRAKRLKSVTQSEIQFLTATGEEQSLLQTDSGLVWQHEEITETLAREIGAVRFQVIEQGSDKLGQLVEITLGNLAEASPVVHVTSIFRIWVDPGI